jgi:hypothetical protein
MTVYPTGWLVCWLTRAVPTPDGPRARYVHRWTGEVSGPEALGDIQDLVRAAMESYRV